MLDKAQNIGEVVTSVSGIACDTAVKTHDKKAQSHDTIEDNNDLFSILAGSDHPKSLDSETLELISRLGFKAASEGKQITRKNLSLFIKIWWKILLSVTLFYALY